MISLRKLFSLKIATIFRPQLNFELHPELKLPNLIPIIYWATNLVGLVTKLIKNADLIYDVTYNSFLIDNKFDNREIFEDVDFVVVTKTNIMNIPGFNCLHTKYQLKNFKSNKASKGIAFFVKENIKEWYSLIQINNEDVIWVKIKKDNIGEEKVLFI